MQYDDDGADLTPGRHISLDGEDLGAASFDADGDGIADSVVVGQGDRTVVATDQDGDGVADSVLSYDASGRLPDSSGQQLAPAEVPPSTQSSVNTAAGSGLVALDADGKQYDLGAPTVDLDEDGVPETVVATGDQGETLAYTDRTGDGIADQIMRISSAGTVEILISDGAGSWQIAETGQMNSAGHYVADTQTAGTGQPTADTQGAHQPAAPSTPGAGLTFTDDEGHQQQLGPATADLDGNGTPETVLGTLQDGTQVAYTDVDGNGTVDQLTMVHPDGQVQISTQTGTGQWQVAETGTVDAAGKYTPGATAPAADTVATQPEVPAADTAPTQPEVPAADTVATQPEVPAADTVAGNITFTDAAGQSYQLGAPTVDFSGNGTPDTVVSVAEGGIVVGYTDTNGDGVVDQVLQVDPSGQVTIGIADGKGGWEKVATGTVGPHGEFVRA